MTPNLEFYELAQMSRDEAARLFDDLQHERSQVISVTCRPGGDLIVVTPFDQETTKRPLFAVGQEIDYVSVH